MSKLHVLILEDSADDAELMVAQLCGAAFDLEWQRVESESEFLAHLDRGYDVILADYRLPGFTGLRALELMQDRGLDIPFILVSGAIGEELAVTAMQVGAADYLLKDRLARLGPAVERALTEKRLRDEKRQVEQTLQLSEKRFRALVEKSSDTVVLLDPQGTVLYISASVTRWFGYVPEEIVGLSGFELAHPEDIERVTGVFAELRQSLGGAATMETRFKHKDGTWRWVTATLTNLLAEPGIEAIVVNFHDITERKRVEEQLHYQVATLSALAEIDREVMAFVDKTAIMDLVCERAAQLLRVPKALISIRESPQSLINAAFGVEDVARAEQEFTRLASAGVMPSYQSGLHDAFAVNEIPAADMRMSEFRACENVRACAGAPVPLPRREPGILIVFDTAPHVWSVGDLETLKLLANTLTIAIEKARLFEETNIRAQQLALLYDAGLALNSTLEPKSQLEFLFKTAMTALQADRAEFFRFDRDQNTLHHELAVGYDEKEIREGVSKLVFAVGEERGLVSHVARTRLPLNVPDVAADARYVLIDPDVRSGLWVPVEREMQLLGVLTVLSTRANAFTPNDERLLVNFANQAAVAMENAQLFEETERRAEQLAALHEIDAAIGGTLDLRTMLQVLVGQAVAQLSVDAVDVLLFNPHTLELEYAAGSGFRTRGIEHTRVCLGEGDAGRAALERQTVVVKDWKPDVARAANFRSEGFVAYYGVPLLVKGQVKGVLEIFHHAPLSPDLEWITFSETLARQAAIAIDHMKLFDDLQRSSVKLMAAYDTTIEGWSRALDLRDKETEGHTLRVTELTLRLARAIKVADEELVHIRRGALLHDIGKMGIPDDILFKPGALTDEKWMTMRKHPQLAYEMLSSIDYLRAALDIPYCHHEKWDGTGYPRGLRGEQIPLAARIFAVVDVWDALRSDRPYRKAWGESKARGYLREQSGKYFDPRVVRAFLKMISE